MLFGEFALEATNWHPGLSLIIFVAGSALTAWVSITSGRFNRGYDATPDPASILNLHNAPASRGDASERGR